MQAIKGTETTANAHATIKSVIIILLPVSLSVNC